MKVLLINTFESGGGAAIACKRLYCALSKNGIDVKMLTLDGKADSTIDYINTSFAHKFKNKLLFYFERLLIFLFNGWSKTNVFKVSLANNGNDISKLKIVKEADIIHLHWINQGMLSLYGIDKLIRSHKNIVWTMHDQWAFTGVCHYAGECKKYYKKCSHCPLLKGALGIDFAKKNAKIKRKIYNSNYLTIIGCSQWITNEARKSYITKKINCVSIPNAIDTSIYFPRNRNQARAQFGLNENKKILLFAACNVSDQRKGMQYLINALKLMSEDSSKHISDIEIAVLGSNAATIVKDIPFFVTQINFINSQEIMCQLYSAVDVFVIPSLEDNLPNTIMEAMACGIPCVGFNTGGIPEMIAHKQTGYISNYCSSEDLAHGIFWTLENAQTIELSKKSRERVLSLYNEDVIASQHMNLYNQKLKLS